MSDQELYDELERWSCAAAQELQEILDDAMESGCDQPGIRNLIEEHNALMQKLTPWQETLAAMDTEDGDAELLLEGCHA